MFWKADAAVLAGGSLFALALGCAIAYLAAEPGRAPDLPSMRKPEGG